MNRRFLIVFFVVTVSSVIAAELPNTPGATRSKNIDPAFVALEDIKAVFNLPVPPSEQMQIAVARLDTLVRSKAASDRQAAAFVNGQYGHMFEQRIVLQNFRTLLADRDAKVRLEAVDSCRGCSGLHEIALPVLNELKPLFSDPDSDVRKAAREVFTSLLAMQARRARFIK